MPSTVSFTCRVCAWRPTRRPNVWTRRLTKFFGLTIGYSIPSDAHCAATETERAFDERGRLGIAGATKTLIIGDKARVILGHCDPTATPTLTLPASGGG